MMIDYDVLDRLRYARDIFNTVGSQKLIFRKKIADFAVFKAFVSNFLYYSLYKGKLEVITHPQCGLSFFIRPLVFDLEGVEILT